MRGIGVRDETAVAGMQTGMNLDRYPMCFRHLNEVVKHVVFEVAEWTVDVAPESLRQRPLAAHQRGEVGLRTARSDLTEQELAIVRDGGLHGDHADSHELPKAGFHCL